MPDMPQAENAANNPAPAPTPEVAPATPATASNPSAFFDAASTDALLFGKPSPPTVAPEEQEAQPAAPAPEPAATAEAPAGEPPQVITEAATPETPAVEAEPKTPESKVLPNRISTGQFSGIEKEAIAYRHALKNEHGEEISLKEAIGIIEDRHRQANEVAAQHVRDNPPPPDPVDALTSEVAELEAKLEAVEDNGLVTTEFKQLQRDHAKKTAQLEVAKLRQEQKQNEHAASFESIREQSRARAIQAFPDAANEGSLLNTALRAEIAARGNESHPLHLSLSDPNAHEQLVREVAETLAGKLASQFSIPREQALASLQGKPIQQPAPVQPAAKPATPAPPTAPAAAPRPAAEMNLSVAPGSQATAPAPVAPTMDSLLQQSLTNPSFDYDKALGLASPGLLIGR